jgi:hypothetical protein
LCGEFKDLVTSLSTKAKTLTYIELHSHLLTHKYLHKITLMTNVLASLLPTLSSGSSLTILPYSYSVAATELEI